MIPCTDPTAVMPRRLAYRIEHAETGEGPFARNVLMHRDGFLRQGPYAMPQPWEDHRKRGKPHNRWDLGGSPAWRVAFPSVAELLRWFDARDLQACIDDGQVFRVYAVSWAHHTLYRSQIVFNRYHAVCLRTLPIVDTRAWFAPLQADRMAA